MKTRRYIFLLQIFTILLLTATELAARDMAITGPATQDIAAPDVATTEPAAQHVAATEPAATDMAGQENATYFCSTANTTLEYTRTTAAGDVKWYHTMKIQDVRQNGDSTAIDYTSYIVNHKHKPYYGKEPAELSATVTEEGVTLNVAESVAAVFRTLFPNNTKISSTGGESALPSDMAPGDTLPDVYASVKVLGLTMKITVTERQVLRFETISTPAGSFSCIVVRERKVEKGMGRNRHTVADTWYAKGLGMVRHDTYNLQLELQTSEILTAIH